MSKDKIDNYILLEDYTLIDIETTGLDKFCRVVEFAALKIRNHKIVDQLSILINPGCSIPLEASKVNHITDEMLFDKPSIKEVSPKIYSFIGDDILVAHYAKFDIGVLNRQLTDGIKNLYLDSISLAKQVFNLRRYSLESLSNYLNLSTEEQKHRALDDTLLTFNLIETIFDIANFKQQPLEIILDQKTKIIGNFLPSEIKPTENLYSSKIEGKHFVFTGCIENMSRKEAMQAVVNKGGLVGSSVIRKTDYLVVGIDCGRCKIDKAQEKIRNNEKIKIITSEEFISLINS